MQTSQNHHPLRVGVVGVSWAGQRAIEAFQAQPNVEVVAIADPDETRTSAVTTKYQIPYAYADYNDLVTRDDIDIVSVATPNFLHAPVALAALQNGKHVLTEKPMAGSLAEAEAMVQAAISAGRVLRVVFNHRQRGDVQVLKRYAETGALGRIYHAKGTWMRRSGIPGLGGWFTDKAKSGGGPLIDLGVHMLDMALHLMDEPEVTTVSAATYDEVASRGVGAWEGSRRLAQGSHFDVEDLATAFIRFQDGSTLLLEASWAIYGRSWDDFGVTLYGSEGGAEIKVVNYSYEDTLRIFTDTAGAPSVIAPRVTKGEGHIGVVREFLAIIHSGEWSAHVGREGLRRTQIIDACYRSAVEGREIALADLASQI
ncbi:MAG: Gfo/Idh/MocA family oxidoreductase [Chloroflexi bacterium]|nr:Gfo/Idh/MocA family oxidoreductase [Chloroflexota bacterium]